MQAFFLLVTTGRRRGGGPAPRGALAFVGGRGGRGVGVRGREEAVAAGGGALGDAGEASGAASGDAVDACCLVVAARSGYVMESATTPLRAPESPSTSGESSSGMLY